MYRPTDRGFFVPTPSRATLFFRTFLPWQLVRFVWINLRMVRMIGIGHHGRAPLRPLLEAGGEDGGARSGATTATASR
ncbi:hypothetical protein ACOQFB_00945 [Anaeromyxobacter sp. Red801]|uniref:hypothetical protein n=1 Tax=Anaeromyxobacter sp. Red801 TaxID=3411632 RepID=UPI003BA2567C